MEDSKSAKVSIIMATYNAANFLHEAIESVQMQMHTNWELLIVDDCSQDQTLQRARQFAEKDSRIRVIKSNTNGGPSSARNLGLNAATGDWITILDCDDRYAPQRLEVLLSYAIKHHLDIVADNQYFCDASNKRVLRLGFFFQDESIHLSAEALIESDCQPAVFSFGLLKPFIRASFLKKQNISYNQDIRLGEDLCFLFSMLMQTKKAQCLSRPLYFYTAPTHSDRSRTDHAAAAWDKYLRQSTQYFEMEIEKTQSQQQKLLSLIEKRRRCCQQMIYWFKARAALKKGLNHHCLSLLFKPDLFFFITRKIMNKFILWKLRRSVASISANNGNPF